MPPTTPLHFRRRAPLPIVLGTAALAWLAPSTLLWAQEAEEETSQTGQHANLQDAEIVQLVADLASPDYSTREAATEALIALGSVAESYVDRAAQSPNLEVNTRAARILAIVSRKSFDEAIEAFLADERGRLGTSLPGWEKARERLGEGPEARRLFADMYRAEPDLMASYDQDDQTITTTFSLRADDLYEQQTQRSQINYQLRTQLYEAIATNVMALMFVGADLEIDLTPMSITKVKMLFQQSWSPDRIAAAAEQDYLRTWLADWIVHRLNLPQRENDGITLGMRYDVPQTVKLAEQVLLRQGKEPLVHVPMYAALCLGKYGQPWQLPLLEQLLDDETVVQQRQRRVNGQVTTYQTQLRDVALVVLLYRTDQSTGEYGFEEIHRHADYLFLPHTIAFEQESSRDAAIAKWRAWRRRNPVFDGEPPIPFAPEPVNSPPEASGEARSAQGEGEPPEPQPTEEKHDAEDNEGAFEGEPLTPAPPDSDPKP